MRERSILTNTLLLTLVLVFFVQWSQTDEKNNANAHNLDIRRSFLSYCKYILFILTWTPFSIHLECLFWGMLLNVDTLLDIRTVRVSISAAELNAFNVIHWTEPKQLSLTVKRSEWEQYSTVWIKHFLNTRRRSLKKYFASEYIFFVIHQFTFFIKTDR